MNLIKLSKELDVAKLIQKDWTAQLQQETEKEMREKILKENEWVTLLTGLGSEYNKGVADGSMKVYQSIISSTSTESLCLVCGEMSDHDSEHCPDRIQM